MVGALSQRVPWSFVQAQVQQAAACERTCHKERCKQAMSGIATYTSKHPNNLHTSQASRQYLGGRTGRCGCGRGRGRADARGRAGRAHNVGAAGAADGAAAAAEVAPKVGRRCAAGPVERDARARA